MNGFCLSALAVCVTVSNFTDGTTITPQATLTDSSDFRAIAEIVAAPHPEVTPELILAIGDRESNLGAALDENGMGDNGNGCGWMQIDKRYHDISQFNCKTDHLKIAEYAINEVYLPYLEQLGGNQDAAIAAYNAGVSSVAQAIKEGNPVESVTTGGDYNEDVLDRANKFR